MTRNRNKELLINTIIISIGQFIPKLISLISLPLITKYLSTSEYGIYDLILSFSNLSVPLLTFLIQQALFRFLISSKDEIEKEKIISNTFIFFGAYNIFILLILIIVGFLCNQFKLIYFIIYILYLSSCIFDLIGQISRGMGKNMYYSLQSIFFSIINLIGIVLCVFYKIVNINSVLIFTSIGYLISSIICFFINKLHKKIKISLYNINTIKKMLKYSFPIIPSSISLWIINLSDRTIITSFLGASLNGIYSAACKLPNLLGSIGSVFSLSWTEHASKTINDKDIDDYYSKLNNNMISLLTGLLVILNAISVYLFHILINSKFNAGLNQIPILFIGIILSVLVSFYGGIYIALKKTKNVGISSFIGCLFNLILNLLFIKKIGLFAASLSTVISYLIVLIYRMLELNKYLKIKYNLKTIVISLIFIIITMINYYAYNIYLNLLSFILGLIYNYIYNKDIILNMLRRKSKI